MKIIFLDIDGVLNSHALWNDLEKEYNRTGVRKEGMEHEIDREACMVLKDIVNETKSKVVISSSWRFSYYDFLVEYLKSYGIEVISRTGKGCSECVRGNEIYSWIKNNEEVIECSYHEYKNYVILDDDSDMLYWQRDNLVKIDNRIGLNENHKKEIIRILNK